jgi:ATP-dependent DNA helicase RecG
VRTVGDLLWLLPRRYDDYRNLKPISSLRAGEEVTVIANLWRLKSRPLKGRNAALVTGTLSDSTAALEVTWFNPYVIKQLHAGRTYVFSGKVDSYLGRLVMRNPVWEPLERELVHAGRLVPVYPLTKGISARWMRNLQKHVVETWGKRVHDPLPEAVRRHAGLVDLSEALEQVHFPENDERLQKARERLAFDELFYIQLGVLRQRVAWQGLSGQALDLPAEAAAAFDAVLPFQFTGAQQEAAQAILADMSQPRPMSRLLQGDVGSGKTVVAAKAMWAAVTSGAQVAMMVPTEILAEQHYRSLSRLFEQLTWNGRPVRIALLTGSRTSSERVEILEALAQGSIDIAVGTHALIQEGVRFRNLGLAVIDEQHRFGVRQRSILRQRGDNGDGSLGAPHLLVMSATPIPRTLSLTVFGDLDVSVIDEMPPGRQPIKTRWLVPRERERALSFVRRQVEAGHQGFIIYPLVEESEQLTARAAVPEYQRLVEQVFPDLRLGLLHGRLKSQEKDAVMLAMQQGEIDVLVATSVVEVGIDIPNATVILIEDAERFGLAQLHQFRGRVGRGEHTSYCILVSGATTPHAAERLQAMEKSQDGFALAEKDLALRGPGDFFGVRQSGLPELKVAQLSNLRILESARKEAAQVLAQDPGLSQPEHQALARRVSQFWQGEGDIS